MNRRKIIIVAAAVVVTIGLAAGCIWVAVNNDNKQKNDQTEANQTTEQQTTEAPETTEPEVEESVYETSNSLTVSAFDGEKDEAYLKKYGLTTYEAPFAEISPVNRLQYVDIGDGVEIYQDGVFCGWFAAWNFSDVADFTEAKVIGDETMDAYVEHRFGGTRSMGCERTGKETLSDGITRYDYAVKVLIQKGDDWLVTTGIYDTVEEMEARGTYTLNVSVFCAEDSNYGYVLCTDASAVTDTQAAKLIEAIAFRKSSFTDKRVTLETGRKAQELFTTVENEYPYVLSYQEMCQWFKDYNGEKLHRIPGTVDDNYSPATCPDIIFYRVDADESIEDAVAAMFKAIMEPLKEKSSVRSFTVTKYFLDQQEILIYEGRENTWLLPFLNGYYAYEGTDGVTMATAKTGSTVKEGMVPLYRQGSDETFQFILMKEGNVYRLQRAVDMGMEVETEEK